MSNKKLGVILLFVSAVALTGFVIFKLTAEKATAPTTSQASFTTDKNIDSVASSKLPSPGGSDAKTIAASEVAKHSSKTDCWTIISGKVYDITSYISRHSGGDEILRACGKDATKLFTTRTTDDGEAVGSGTAHSSSAQSQLEDLFIGDLKD